MRYIFNSCIENMIFGDGFAFWTKFVGCFKVINMKDLVKHQDKKKALFHKAKQKKSI